MWVVVVTGAGYGYVLTYPVRWSSKVFKRAERYLKQEPLVEAVHGDVGCARAIWVKTGGGDAWKQKETAGSNLPAVRLLF